MARAEQKVNDLLAEDSDMDDALSTVLTRADANDGTVEWSDVKGDLTSGQWGRIIEKGVLTSASGNGFSVQNPDGVRAALNGGGSTTTAGETTSAVDDDEGSSWSVYDKLAGVGALAMMSGYYVTSIRDTLGGALDLLIGPLDQVLPFYAVVLILAMLTGLYSTLLQANLMDTEKMGKYQSQMQEIQDRRKEAKERGDDEALERIQQEQMDAMGDQLGMFKEQFRPMAWITLLTIPVFLWLYWMIQPGAGRIPDAEMQVIMPLAGEVSWNKQVLIMPAWIVWYFLCSMGFNQVIRKGLNIQMTPTASS
ncbi:DUF106 domain-containing protein [Halocatena marina]|uniref:DUF106 domain-containing protein n=1 Tax=Halocatena marina TaxID=2934937 RepID=A0ABD5YGL9_9EURY|nr:DUF106 domain-containing protein [Halocatena marina]